MNPQELFIDVSSGRFLDGQTPIPTAKPNFFSDEKRSVNLTVLKVKNNIVRPVTPAQNARYKMRIGTPALKLADAIDTPTASPILFTAQATAVTAPASQATGVGVVFNYTPVTAQFEAIVSTQSAVTALFDAKIFRINPVTAAVTVGISSATQFVQEFSSEASFSENELSAIISPPGIEMIGVLRSLSLTATLNVPQQALFSATVSGGSVTTIAINFRGAGYPNGNYNISFSGASTAGTITASATAVALDGIISSITLNDGGSGYSGAPSATLFTPDKQLSSINIGGYNISNLGISGGKRTFKWAQGSSSVSLPNVAIRFSNPDTTSTTIPTSVPSAFLVYNKDDIWQINIISNGYGYVNTPTVSHDSALVGSPKLVFNDTDLLRGVQTSIDTTNTVIVEHGGCVESFVEPPRSSGFNFDDVFNLGVSGSRQIGLVRFRYAFGINRVTYTQEALRDISVAEFLTSGDSPSFYSSDRAGQAKISFLKLDEYNFNSQIVALANKQCFVVGVPRQFLAQNERSPIWIIETGPAREEQFFNSFQPRGQTNEVLPVVTLPTGINRGGIFNSSIRMIDGGNITPAKLSGLSTVKSIDINKPIFESPVAASATVSTLSNYVQNIYSQLPTILTRPGTSSTEYYIGSPGFGFTGKARIDFVGVTQATGGVVVTASLTNAPAPYIDGTYSCEVQSPSVGTKATIDFVVLGGRGRVVILDGGAGYTSKPIVTAPNPNGRNGFVTNLILKNKPVGYNFDTPYKIEVGASPVTGGNCEAFFTVTSAIYVDTISLIRTVDGLRAYKRDFQGGVPPLGPNEVGTIIDDQIISDDRRSNVGTIRGRRIVLKLTKTSDGFGYTTAPTITAPVPDSQDFGKLVGITLKNSPQGYIPNKQYSLDIQASPNSSGSAIANFSISESGVLTASIVNFGFGYTSKPVITAPGPDQRLGIITSAKKTFSGAGYAPGIYKCDVSESPSGGETAEISFVVEEGGASRFIVDSTGYGYITAPAVTAPLQPGNIITGITITCQGSFYAPNTATFSIIDSSGFGAVAGTPLLFSGKINNIQILNGGYGYSNTPIIEFGAPTEPVITDIQASQVQGDFEITTASANAILTTANQRDVLLEVYETDGTNEQVVVQGTVNLAKRVLE